MNPDNTVSPCLDGVLSQLTAITWSPMKVLHLSQMTLQWLYQINELLALCCLRECRQSTTASSWYDDDKERTSTDQTTTDNIISLIQLLSDSTQLKTSMWGCQNSVILHAQNFVQNWPLCAELTNLHRNCKILQILFGSISLKFGTVGCHVPQQSISVQSNKTFSCSVH